MGMILDSSILIAADRGCEGVAQILKRVRAAHGDTEAGVSAVTIVELTHGIYRAKTDGDRERRRLFTTNSASQHSVIALALIERFKGSPAFPVPKRVFRTVVSELARGLTCPR